MSCLENPVMPCAMTGACAVLSGFAGLSVVIHGSSGCYYYPRSILRTHLHSTYLLESEIVFGTVDRLQEGQLMFIWFLISELYTKRGQHETDLLLLLASYIYGFAVHIREHRFKLNILLL